MRDDAVLGRALPLDRGLGPVDVKDGNYHHLIAIASKVHHHLCNIKMFSGSQFVITISRLGFETRLELVNAAITVHKPKGTQ